MATQWGGQLLGLAVPIATTLLMLAAALVVVRLGRGPSVADRALALDLLGFVAVGLVAVVVVESGQTVLFDAAMALALVAFLATVALARLVEGSAGG